MYGSVNCQVRGAVFVLGGSLTLVGGSCAAHPIRTRVHLRASLLGVPAAVAAVIESLPLRICPMTHSRLRGLSGSRGRFRFGAGVRAGGAWRWAGPWGA